MLPASIAMCGACHVSVWHRAADGPDVVWLRGEIARGLGNEPGAIMVIVPGDTPLSSASARHEAAEMVRELGDQLDAVAVVIEGDGFWKAAVRAMFAGIALLARPPMPWRIFSEPESAAQWLSMHTRTSKTTLVRVIRELRGS